MTKKYDPVIDLSAFQEIREEMRRNFKQIVDSENASKLGASVGDALVRGIETLMDQTSAFGPDYTGSDHSDPSAGGDRAKADAKKQATDFQSGSADESANDSDNSSAKESAEKSAHVATTVSDPESSKKTASGSSDITAWQPASDLYETRDAFVIELELPGIDPACVELEVTGSNIVVSASVAEQKNDLSTSRTDLRMLKQERQSGSFIRKFQLPDNAPCDDISADARHGLLTITVPKAGRMQARKIKIAGS